MPDTRACSFGLENERVSLSLLDARDRELYVATYTDPVMMAQVGAPLDGEAARVAFDRTCKANLEAALRHRCWVITAAPDGAVAGLLGLGRKGDVVEIGGMILPEWQGRGISGHAFPLGMQAAFSDPTVAHMMIRYRSTNTFAAGLMYKIGFNKIADAHPDDGLERWWLTREEWMRWRAMASRPSPCVAGENE